MREICTQPSGEPVTPVIRTPTLVLWGERDTALGPELTDGMGPLVADLTLQRLPDVSHWILHEAAQTVNERIAAFIGEAIACRGAMDGTQ